MDYLANIDWSFVLWAGMAFGVGALVQAFTGFGSGIISVAILSLGATVIGATAVANLCGVALTLGILWRLRRSVRWRIVGMMIGGVVVGLPVGVYFLSAISDLYARKVMGGLILGFGLWSMARGKAGEGGEPGLVGSLLVGLASGLMGGAFCMSGPPVIAYVYSRSMGRDELKATVGACFAFNSAGRAVIATAVGQITSEAAVTACVMLPVIFGATWVGLRLSRNMPTARFRSMAWGLFVVLGILLCAS